MDPYVVTSLIADTTLLVEDSQAEGLIKHYRDWSAWKATATIE